MPRAQAHIAAHVQRRIQCEILRKITDHQVAPGRHFAAVRRLQTGKDFQKRRFAAAVSPHQTDAVALINAQRRGIKDRPLAIADDQIGCRKD